MTSVIEFAQQLDDEIADRLQSVRKLVAGYQGLTGGEVPPAIAALLEPAAQNGAPAQLPAGDVEKEVESDVEFDAASSAEPTPVPPEDAGAGDAERAAALAEAGRELAGDETTDAAKRALRAEPPAEPSSPAGPAAADPPPPRSTGHDAKPAGGRRVARMPDPEQRADVQAARANRARILEYMRSRAGDWLGAKDITEALDGLSKHQCQDALRLA
jgi:hypothetical protein